MQPGDSYEAPIYTAKEAYLAAINTMQNNHPNDWFTLVSLQLAADLVDGTTGRFNCVACPLGTNYNYATAALFFPFSTINADGSAEQHRDHSLRCRPRHRADPLGQLRGHAARRRRYLLRHGPHALPTTSSPSPRPSDTTLRTFVTSSPITFPTGMAGGMGRKGAQKVIIFETDGLANCHGDRQPGERRNVTTITRSAMT